MSKRLARGTEVDWIDIEVAATLQLENSERQWTAPTELNASHWGNHPLAAHSSSHLLAITDEGAYYLNVGVEFIPSERKGVSNG